VLAILPHLGSQPLAFLYLSQIPQTGLNLGPVGTTLYWIALVFWALALAYLLLFGAIPLISRSARNFGNKISIAINMRETMHINPPIKQTVESAPTSVPLSPIHEKLEYARGYSSYDGFKSFAKNGALSIDDIVKGLARNHSSATSSQVVDTVRNVEPIYENVEPIMPKNVDNAHDISTPSDIRGFIAALVEGDRNAVFAGLRQQIRESGIPEQFISKVACALDDAYRARIDGTICDAEIVRLTARLNTPTLEKLVGSLTTAIDSSYSAGVTGAKLALTRALATIGA
jgi:hypothetical protein